MSRRMIQKLKRFLAGAGLVMASFAIVLPLESCQDYVSGMPNPIPGFEGMPDPIP